MKMENLRLGAQPALQEVSYEQLMKKYGRGESSPEEAFPRMPPRFAGPHLSATGYRPLSVTT